jgi:hypothetical protein
LGYVHSLSRYNTNLMSTEITINQDQIDINVDTTVVTIEAPQGGYPLPNNVYSVFGRIGNVVAQEGDYTLTQLGGVTITNPLTGQALVYNGTSWVNNTETYVGTVTSVNMSVPTGLTISGNPITTAGTLALGLASGYSIPTTASQATWNTAYNDSIVSAAVTGVETKTLTLNQQDGGTITASWSDYDTAPVTSVFGRTGAITAQSGDYTTTQVTEGTNLYYTDARARGSVSGGTGISYDSSTGVITNTITQYTDSNARAALSFTAGSGAYNSTTGVITIPTNNNQITNGAGYITTADLTGLVPYTGATANVDLGSYDLTTDIVNLNQLKAVGSGGLNIYSNSGTHIALMGGGGGAGTTFYGGIIGTSASFASSGGSDTFAINHSSGSGIALNITKGGNGEGLYINKTGGSGNAATIIGTLNATTLVKNGGTSSQFLKADGSVDATSYQPLITAGTTSQYYRGDKTFQTLDTSVVPENTNLYFTNTRARAAISETVTGLDYDNTTGVLSTSAGYGIPTTASQTNWDTAYTNRITSASAPLSIASNVISISQANTTTDGYLSSTDWNTFNNKQAAGNYITALTGEATASGPGSASVTLTNSAVIGKVLTGLNVTGGSVNATDSILDAFGKVQNQINGLIGGSIYQSVWNASTNTPTLTSSVGTKGYYYIVNVAGSTNLNGITDWKVGDWAIYDGTAWQKVDNTDAVSSVNGFTGAVSLTTDNISEGSTNLYFTNTRAQNAITLTTTGTSGAASYSGGTLNIPQYQAVLTNPVTGTGTTNTLPKFTAASTIGNSNITDTGSLITLGSNTNISAGSLGIGTSSVSTYSIRASRTLTGGVQAYGITNDGNVQSDVTTTARGFYSLLGTQAATFTLNALIHYHAQQGTFGAGSSVTNQYGFAANSALIGGTNNYGFYGDIPSGTNRWNLYMNGTANNYLAGSLGIGSTSLSNRSLHIGKNITGGTTAFAVLSNGAVQSDVTSQANNFTSTLTTAAAAFTLPTYYHFIASQGTIGSTSAVTNQYGFAVENTLIGATNNYGFFGAVAAGTGRWNLFMTGTADNYLAGNLAIGTFAVGGGPILTITLSNGGSGYVDGTYTDVALIGGGGNGALATFVVSGGVVTTATLTWGGNNYVVGGSLSASNANLGGTGSGIAMTIESVDGAQFKISSPTSANIILRRASSVTTGNEYGSLEWESSDSTVKASGLQAKITALAAGSNAGGILTFSTRSGTAGTSLVEAMRIGSEGGVGIGATTLTQYGLRISKNITGSTISYAQLNDGIIQSGVTSVANTAAASFTLGTLYHYRAIQGTFGAGSAVTSQVGFAVDNSLSGATNNYAFFSDLASGTNRWNLYMNGTAANYMAGNLNIGTTLDTGSSLQVYKSYLAGVYSLDAGTGGIAGISEVARFYSNGNGGAGRGVGIVIGAAGSLNTVSVARLIGYQENASATANNASFAIEVANTSGTLTERIRVKNTGQMRFVPLASDPLNAQAGDVYYNSTISALKLYDGTVWRTITVI